MPKRDGTGAVWEGHKTGGGLGICAGRCFSQSNILHGHYSKHRRGTGMNHRGWYRFATAKNFNNKHYICFLGKEMII